MTSNGNAKGLHRLPRALRPATVVDCVVKAAGNTVMVSAQQAVSMPMAAVEGTHHVELAPCWEREEFAENYLHAGQSSQARLLHVQPASIDAPASAEMHATWSDAGMTLNPTAWDGQALREALSDQQ